MDVTVNTHPAPNQIDVCGAAVARNCPEVTGSMEDGFQLTAGRHEIATWSKNEAYSNRWNIHFCGAPESWKRDEPRANDSSSSASSEAEARILAWNHYRQHWDRIIGCYC
jgi:hypothetical protein